LIRPSGTFVVTLLVSSLGLHAETVAERVHRDLSRGENVVITSYVGLWYGHLREPRRNLYWGSSCGHSTLFSRKAEIRRRLPFLAVTDYRPVLEKTFAQDPIAVNVFEAPVPGRSGKLKVVALAYADMSRAVREMASQLKTGTVPPSLGNDAELRSLLARSYVIGYWGHNIYYGGVDSDDLETLRRTTADLPRGVFFVGCQSARWYPGKFVDESIEPLLFTTTNMAPEAYIALALYDGLARGLGTKEIHVNVTRAYAVYQKLPKLPVSLFVNDRAGLRGTSAARRRGA
jgi:hypothetical protein